MTPTLVRRTRSHASDSSRFGMHPREVMILQLSKSAGSSQENSDDPHVNGVNGSSPGSSSSGQQNRLSNSNVSNIGLTPPGSPSPYWKSRLTTIKNSVLGTPRFHRRKMMQGMYQLYQVGHFCPGLHSIKLTEFLMNPNQFLMENSASGNGGICLHARFSRDDKEILVR